MCCAVRFHIRAGYLQQRADEAPIRTTRRRIRTVRSHPPQPGQPGATQGVHEHRLCLVVGVVPDGHAVRADAGGHVGQESVAHLACCLLDGDLAGTGVRRHIPPFDGGRQAPLVGQRSDELGIGVGLLAAQFVIQVSHVQGKAAFSPQPVEHVQQAERIWPTRHASNHRRASR